MLSGPSPSHTQHWILVPPQPTAPPFPGPSPEADVAGSGTGAVWSRCLLFSPVFPVALTSLFAQPSTRVPASGGGGEHRGHGRDVRMPGGGSPGGLAEAGAAGGEHRDRAGPRGRIALRDIIGDVPQSPPVSRPSRVAAATLPRYRPGTPLPAAPEVFRAPRSSRSPTRRRRRAEAGGGSVGRLYRVTALLHQNRAGTGRAPPCDPSRPAPPAAPGNQGRAAPGGRRGRPGSPPGPRATG